MKEKLSTCFLRPDRLRELDFSTIVPGFSFEEVSSKKLGDRFATFTCGLCNHFIKGPFSCQYCKAAYCELCIDWLHYAAVTLNVYGAQDSPNKFLCLRPTCWSFGRLGEKAELESELMEIYNFSMFNCCHKYCIVSLSWSHYKSHVSKCIRGPAIQKVDTSAMRGSTRLGETWKHQARTQTYSLNQLVNPAIRECIIETHESRRENLRRGYEYISTHHPDETAILKEYDSTYYFNRSEQQSLRRQPTVPKRPRLSRVKVTQVSPDAEVDSPFVFTDPRRSLSPDELAEVESIVSRFSAHEPGKELVPLCRGRPVFNKKMPSVEHTWRNRSQPALDPLPAGIQARIDANRPKVGITDIISIHIACMTITDGVKQRPKAVWLAVVNSDEDIVFESFIRYPRDMIVQDNHNFHGLTSDNIKFGKPLRLVVQQLISFLGAAKTIICLDSCATFSALDLTDSDQALISNKVRDLTKYYSPKVGEKFAYRYVLHLLFEQYDIWKYGRSPVNEARAGVWLYLYDKDRIEEAFATRRSVPHQLVSDRYDEFMALKEQGVLDWPESFQSSIYIRPIRRQRYGFP